MGLWGAEGLEGVLDSGSKGPALHAPCSSLLGFRKRESMFRGGPRAFLPGTLRIEKVDGNERVLSRSSLSPSLPSFTPLLHSPQELGPVCHPLVFFPCENSRHSTVIRQLPVVRPQLG